MPAVALRAFTNSASPSFWRRAFTASKLAFGMKISPRTSSTVGASPRRRSGTLRIGRTLAVTSSPFSPSPRVIACTSRPRSYRSEMATPSILGSATTAGTSPSDSVQRACQVRKSSME